MIKKIKYIICFSISLFIYLFSFYKKNKNIWIVGSGNGLYENNAAVFHSYLLKKTYDESIDVYFVTDNRLKLCDSFRGNVLIRGSIMCYLLSLRAKVIFVDTCNSDVAPGVQKYLKALKVNLNHGFEGFKKLNTNYYKNFIADIHCAASEQEKKIKVECCGAPKNKVIVTGYPRFDAINKHVMSESKKILFFPTWRPWLDSKNTDFLLNSNYFIHLEEFIFSTELSRILEENDTILYYKPHHKIPHSCINGSSERIVLVGANQSLTKLISTCDILITDYSSVAWDFIYNERPVIFFTFDIDEYNEKSGLYIDVREEPCCIAASRVSDLNFLLEKSLLNKSEDDYSGLRSFFDKRDNDNCKRIYALVKERLNEG